MRYKGWVPTVNGRLSFKIIGETRYPSEPEYVNSSDKSHLYLCARQTRQLSDVLFEPILGPILGLSGKFDFVICGRSRKSRMSPDAKLVGKVYVFHRATYSGSLAEKLFSKSMADMRAPNPGGSNSALRACYLDLHENLGRSCDFSSDFVLNRDGIVCVSNISWQNSTLHSNTEAYLGEGETDLDQCIADQIYFFIRDLTHQHQHHSADADTIITTQPVSGKDQLSWTSDILFSLYYHIITVKRKEAPAEHVRALGILAYVQSFKNVVKARAETIGAKLNFPTFDDSSAKESLKATKDYIDLRINEQKKSGENSRSFLIWVVATIFTVVNYTIGFADKNVKSSNFVVSSANLLKENSYVIPLLALLALAYWISNLILKPRYDFKRDVVRLSLASRGIAALIILFLGVLFLGGSILATLKVFNVL